MLDRAPEAEQAALSSMEAEVLRLSRLVDELLRPPDDGRLLPTERRPVDLGALAAELCALLSGRADRAGVTLRCEPSAGLIVLGDRDRLKQVLLNLLDNALRVTPAGGQVIIAGALADGLVRVAVADDGPGVPPDQRVQIWERGLRGAPATAGSAGLGLAIAREIIAAHGGRAYLDERSGPGARFVIELPHV
jgi:signal transduction histidine kinase